MPSAFKVQSTPTKKNKAIDSNRDQEKKAITNGKDEGSADNGKRKTKKTGDDDDQRSPSVSPERRNRRQDINNFEEMVNRTSVPRKSHGKVNKN